MQNVHLTPNLQFWLQWLGAFLIVCALLAIGAAIQEYRLWKRGK